MVPGLLIGLRRTTAIDFDAVAYRTAAVLVEDPGQNDKNISIMGYTFGLRPWELSNVKEGAVRMGLAVSSQSPNILLIQKIEKFNNSTSFFSYPEDYRDRLLFSNMYRFNVTLINKTETGEELKLIQVGDPRPELTSSGYGYIRRVVKIKDSPTTMIDLNASYANSYNVSNWTSVGEYQNFSVTLNLTDLLDPGINPMYRFDPRMEPIEFSLSNFGAKLNNTNHTTINAASPSNWTDWGGIPPDNATLQDVLLFVLSELKEPQELNSFITPNDYNFRIKNVRLGIDTSNNALSDNILIENDTTIILQFYPEFMYKWLSDSSILEVKFIFYDPVPQILIDGTHPIEYCNGRDPANNGCLNQPPLQDGWLEVAVW